MNKDYQQKNMDFHPEKLYRLAYMNPSPGYGKITWANLWVL